MPGVIALHVNLAFCRGDVQLDRYGNIKRTNGLDPESYLRNVLSRIADHPLFAPGDRLLTGLLSGKNLIAGDHAAGHVIAYVAVEEPDAGIVRDHVNSFHLGGIRFWFRRSTRLSIRLHSISSRPYKT